MRHTLESIAKLAGVSRGTVSRVINNQPGVNASVREKVKQVIAETGYVPHAQARSLAGGKTHNVGVAVFGNDPNFLTHHIFYEVLQGVQQSLAAYGYDLLLFSNRADADREYWKRIGDDRKIDGLIVMGERIREEYVEYYHAKHIPYVLVGKRYFQRIPLFCVTSDYRRGGYEAGLHLLSRGRRDIVFIQGYPNTYHEDEKRAGLEQALAQSGLRLAPDAVLDGYTEQSLARERLLVYLREGKALDGVFAGNDTMAFGAIEALRECGRAVPQDVSVVGYDDIHAARFFHPPLTTVRQDKIALGGNAVKLLMRLIADDGAERASSDDSMRMASSSPGTEWLVESKLIVRESS